MITETQSEQYKLALVNFLEAYPNYTTTAKLDSLRATDYKRLDDNRQIYLDYTGGGLYAQSQLDAHFDMLRTGVWGNPHSQNPTSLAMTEHVEQARGYVLTYFRADPDEYDVIFTPNASGALKLIAESFPFQTNGRFLALADNHNSVNGIREFARAKGTQTDYTPTLLPDLRIDETTLTAQLNQLDSSAPNLFAYPAQSNYTGVQHDLGWIAAAQQRGWHVLLDAAAFVPTNRLDLSVYHPDFVSLSFYKMFGHPTGIGCLIGRKEALRRLVRPWFAGGTITTVSTMEAGWHYMIDGPPAFEEGTVNYLNIPAVEIGLHHIESIGIECIHDRVIYLTDWLLTQITGLKHDNGLSLVHVQGPTTVEQRGGTISFSLNDPTGQRLDYRRIEMLANKANISLRTGCFCNPGSGEISHNLLKEEMATAFGREKSVSFDELYVMAAENYGKYPSSIRISLGIVSNFQDVYAFMNFLEAFKNRPAAEMNSLPIRSHNIPDTA